MNVFIIGIGLIGGSFAIGIKEALPEAKVYGIDKNKENLDKALALGLIDEKSSFREINNADVVILATPVYEALPILSEILDMISDDCLVFDVGSTKEKLCKVVKNHTKRRNYLATHPITENKVLGSEAAEGNFFKSKIIIICEVEKTAFKLQERAMDIFARLGIRVRYMDSASHDKHMALSHVHHV